MDDGPGKRLPCPQCKKHEAIKLTFSSSLSSHVDYYRCEACGFVWVTERKRTRVRALSSEKD